MSIFRPILIYLLLNKTENCDLKKVVCLQSGTLKLKFRRNSLLNSKCRCPLVHTLYIVLCIINNWGDIPTHEAIKINFFNIFWCWNDYLYDQVYLNFSVEKSRMDLHLFNGEETDVIKMEHLSIGRPVLDTGGGYLSQ